MYLAYALVGGSSAMSSGAMSLTSLVTVSALPTLASSSPGEALLLSAQLVLLSGDDSAAV